jgi:hypothetical protein
MKNIISALSIIADHLERRYSSLQDLQNRLEALDLQKSNAVELILQDPDKVLAKSLASMFNVSLEQVTKAAEVAKKKYWAKI